jgi:5-bromo-4-chloroindolyl phosphate hydrolysis protein
MNNIKIAKKKPIEIEVIQITGTDENIKEIQNFCGRNYLDEFGLSDDDIKEIDEYLKEANKFFAKVSIKDFFIGESAELQLLES